jgi:hypothetical protein
VVGDSKLISYANRKAFFDAGVSVVAPASKNYVAPEVLAACDAEAAAVDYVAERDADKAPVQRGHYRGVRGLDQVELFLSIISRGCCGAARSTRVTSSSRASWASSPTTTATPSRSAGPTTGPPLKAA